MAHNGVAELTSQLSHNLHDWSPNELYEACLSEINAASFQFPKAWS